MLPLVLEFVRPTADGEVPSPLAVTVPLIKTVLWDQGAMLTAPFTSEITSELEGPLLPPPCETGSLKLKVFEDTSTLDR